MIKIRLYSAGSDQKTIKCLVSGRSVDFLYQNEAENRWSKHCFSDMKVLATCKHSVYVSLWTGNRIYAYKHLFELHFIRCLQRNIQKTTSSLRRVSNRSRRGHLSIALEPTFFAISDRGSTPETGFPQDPFYSTCTLKTTMILP